MNFKDVENAMFDFLEAFHASPPAIPELRDAEGEWQIFKGGQNGNVRPSGTDYLIFTATSQEPLEWNFENFETDLNTLDDGTLTIAPMYKIYFQVDSWGKYGKERAMRLNHIFNSGKGQEFFRDYWDRYGGIGVVKTRAGNNTTEVDGTNKYASCWTGDYAVTARLTTPVPQDWLDRLRIEIRGVKYGAR